MPRVLHLIETWGPGGAETVFLEVAGGIRDRGWESLTVVPREGWLSRQCRERGLDLLLMGPRRSTGDILHVRDLVRVIRRHRVDLLHAHLFGSAVYGALAAALCRIPVLATIHGLWDVKHATGIRRLKVFTFDRLCQRKVFVSEPLRAACVRTLGIRRQSTEVIENGIEMERFRRSEDRAFREELGVRDEEFLVGSIGNLRPAKNYELLLRVAARQAGGGRPFRFVIVGACDGEIHRRLVERRSALGLDGTVHFAGFREDVENVLASLDAYLLTSHSEGFSLTTVQAMAAGLPVVATRCGGPEAIIDDGRTGFLVDRGDVTAIVETLRALAVDESSRVTIGAEAAREVQRRYARERMIDRYEIVYRKLLGERVARPGV